MVLLGSWKWLLNLFPANALAFSRFVICEIEGGRASNTLSPALMFLPNKVSHAFGMGLIKSDVPVVSVKREYPVGGAFHDGLQIGIDGFYNAFELLPLGYILDKHSNALYFGVIIDNGMVCGLNISVVRVPKSMFTVIVIPF